MKFQISKSENQSQDEFDNIAKANIIENIINMKNINNMEINTFIENHDKTGLEGIQKPYISKITIEINLGYVEK